MADVDPLIEVEMIAYNGAGKSYADVADAVSERHDEDYSTSDVSGVVNAFEDELDGGDDPVEAIGSRLASGLSEEFGGSLFQMILDVTIDE